MKTIVYFGDNDESISSQARLSNPGASLIDCSNYTTFLSDDIDGVFYTSLADLPEDLQIVYDILMKSDLVVYCPPKKWNDNKSIDNLNVGNSTQGLTESLLLQVSTSVEVKNIELCYESKYTNNLSDRRKSVEPQLWISGCSVSHGVGLLPNQRYGDLLSEKLQLKCSFLTAPGSSIEWASQQILKSDLKKGDIVCWGLTSYRRIPFYFNGKLHHVLANFYKINKEFNKILPIELIDNENRLFQALESIRSVINFCEKLQVTLIVFNALSGIELDRLLIKEKYFYQFPYQLNKDHTTYKSRGLQIFYDFASDNEHPGPLTHKKYSDFLAHIIDNVV
jgi:hypothetical protein